MRLRRRLTPSLVAALLAVLAPAASAATSGGAAPVAPAQAIAPMPTPAAATPAGATVGGAAATPVATASANGITLSARTTALLAHRATVTGTAPAGVRALRIEHQHAATGGWVPVAIATPARDGAFSTTWRPRAVGHLRLRAVPVSSASRASGATPEVEVTVLRPAVATWYGPGFWGRRTACGVRLRRTTLGVAHRTLPCGTQVQLLHRGRTLVVPVIDRGPFTRGRAWDLTKATHAALGGQAGLLTVGALPLVDVARVQTPAEAPPVLRSGRP